MINVANRCDVPYVRSIRRCVHGAWADSNKKRNEKANEGCKLKIADADLVESKRDRRP